MVANGIFRLLHLFFAFSFVGTLIVADWNGRAARATSDWAQRSLLLNICRIVGGIAGLGSLLMTGLLGNVVAARMGVDMRSSWMISVNLLWLIAVVVMGLLTRPAVARLARIAASGPAREEAAAFDLALRRWRLGNVVLSLLYLAFLVLMVFRW